MTNNTKPHPKSLLRQRPKAMYSAAAAAVLVIATLTGCGGASSGNQTQAASAPAANNAHSSKALTDVCTTLTVARVNELTGLNYLRTDADRGGGTTATSTGCHYVKETGPADMHALDLYVFVARGPNAATYYDGTVKSWSAHPGYAPISGLGTRAVGTENEMAVDYGGLLIEVDDRGQATTDALSPAQLRAVVDELYKLYG